MTTSPPFPLSEELIERAARAADPIAWQFIDAHKNDDPPHPAIIYTVGRQMKIAGDIGSVIAAEVWRMARDEIVRNGEALLASAEAKLGHEPILHQFIEAIRALAPPSAPEQIKEPK